MLSVEATALLHRARRDPALATLVGHPSAPFLPADPLTVTVDLASGPWFLGSEGTLRLLVRGLVGEAPLVVEGDPGWRGPASVVRVASRRAADASGEREADLAWTWRVDGPGTLTIGPLRVTQGDASVTVDAVSVSLVAPPSRADVPSRAGALPLPSAILGDRPVPSVWRSDDVVWVALPDDARVTEPAGAPRPWRYDPGERDLPGIALVPLPRTTARVVARGEAGVLLDEVVSGGEGATGERRR